MMNISVALCTYNAAGYLVPQLESIAAQTRLPDELVVCDDGSRDDTAARVRQFAAAAPFPVRFEVNPENLGSAANFAKAVGRCGGGLIVLADQDDVWLPHKLQQLHDALAAAPCAGFAFSDAALIDQEGRSLGMGLWQAIGFSSSDRRRVLEGRAAEALLHRDFVTGATMAFRAEFRELLLPVPEGWVHDAWFALLIAAVADCLAIAEPLIQYRQHPRQQIGANKENLLEGYLRVRSSGRRRYQTVADNYAAARARLVQFQSRLRDPEILSAIDRKVSHYLARARMRDRRHWRLPIILSELARQHYAKFSTGWKSLAADILG